MRGRDLCLKEASDACVEFAEYFEEAVGNGADGFFAIWKKSPDFIHKLDAPALSELERFNGLYFIHAFQANAPFSKLCFNYHH